MDDAERTPALRAGVDWTALASAEARFAEANHDRPWFDDPLAPDLIAAARRSASGNVHIPRRPMSCGGGGLCVCADPDAVLR